MILDIEEAKEILRIFGPQTFLYSSCAEGLVYEAEKHSDVKSFLDHLIRSEYTMEWACIDESIPPAGVQLLISKLTALSLRIILLGEVLEKKGN